MVKIDDRLRIRKIAITYSRNNKYRKNFPENTTKKKTKTSISLMALHYLAFSLFVRQMETMIPIGINNNNIT